MTIIKLTQGDTIGVFSPSSPATEFGEKWLFLIIRRL